MIMEKESYYERVGRAKHPVQLVVVTYDLLLFYLNEALSRIDNGNSVDRFKSFETEIDKALSCIAGLVDSLDMDLELSNDLWELYIYINGLILKAKTLHRRKELDEAIRIISELATAFSIIEKNTVDELINSREIHDGRVERGAEYFSFESKSEYKV